MRLHNHTMRHSVMGVYWTLVWFLPVLRNVKISDKIVNAALKGVDLLSRSVEFQVHIRPPRAGYFDEPDTDESPAVVILLLVSPIKALNRETASAARLLQRIVRRAVSRAPSRFGESAARMCRQVLALMTIPQRHSFSSFAIDLVIGSIVVSLRKECSGRFSRCANEF